MRAKTISEDSHSYDIKLHGTTLGSSPLGNKGRPTVVQVVSPDDAKKGNIKYMPTTYG